MTAAAEGRLQALTTAAGPTVQPQLVAAAIVCLHQYTDYPAPSRHLDAARCRANSGFELMGIHARATADIALKDCAGSRGLQCGMHMVRADGKCRAIAEVAVVGLRHNRHKKVEPEIKVVLVADEALVDGAD